MDFKDYVKFFVHLDNEVFGCDYTTEDKLIKVKKTMKIKDVQAQIYQEYKKLLREKGIYEEDLSIRRNDTGIFLYELFTLQEAKVQEGSIITITKTPESPCKLTPNGTFTSIFSKEEESENKNESVNIMKVDLEPSKDHHKRLSFLPGLNLECECVNNKCIWRNEKQFYHCRFGKLDLVKLMAESRCRKCYREFDHDKTKRVALVNCKYKYEFIDEKCDLYKSEWINVHQQKQHQMSWESFFSQNPDRMFRKITFIVLKDDGEFKLSCID